VGPLPRGSRGATLGITRGLPPSVKFIIDEEIKKQPTVKLQSLKNVLWETHALEKDLYNDQVTQYFYHGSKGRKTLTTGVSSFGTVSAFVKDHELIDMIIKHTKVANSSYLDVRARCPLNL
jgi:hypothetical protein